MATAKAIAAYRGARAVELAVAGWSYDAITVELGYKSRGSVSKALWKTIERRSATAVDAYRERELQRLDALERAHWGKALAGSAAAAEVVLGVVEKRIRLLGLDRQEQAPDAPRSVVDAGYCERVREAHERQPGAVPEARAGGDGNDVPDMP